MEIWDLYTQNRIKTGETMIRGEEIPGDRYHLIVHVWIVNSRGEYLISQRAANRPTFPLLWEMVGGSVIAGEDSLTGALREVKEEVGIDLSPEMGELLCPEAHAAAGERKFNVIRDVWLFRYDGEVSLQNATTDEVADVKWMTAADIEALSQAGKTAPSLRGSFGIVRERVEAIKRKKEKTMSTLSAGVNRDEALKVLKTYNQEPFHIRHGLTVAAVMGWFAENLGYGDEKEFWSLVGLMHDVDFEKWPEEHCVKAPELLSEAGFTPEFIHAVVSHGWGLVPTDAKPELEMEKVLFACDELTGLIGAAALMRPSKSTKDMELKSLKKKYKDKKFAAGCSREVIAQGAGELGWELDILLEKTLAAMAATEDAVEAEVAANT